MNIPVTAGVPAYPVHLEPDKESGGFTGEFRGVYGVAEGDTVEEALENARDVLDIIFSTAIEDNEQIPAPGKPRKGDYLVSPPTATYIKYLLWQTAKQKEMRRIDIARAMHVKPAQVDRIFDINHGSRIEQLEAAAAAMGKKLVIDLQDIA